MAELLARMTLDEKLAQLGCSWSTTLVTEGGYDEEVAAQHIHHGIGQVTRIGGSTGPQPAESAALMNAIQRVAVERTRLGIPVLMHEEAVGCLCQRDATVFPQALSLAATCDPPVIRSVDSVNRTQMQPVGTRLALAPTLEGAPDPHAAETRSLLAFLADRKPNVYRRYDH